MNPAIAILIVMGAYAAIGFVFAVAFVTVGVSRVDSAARGAPVGFRLLILPGTIALWPVLALRWLRAAPPLPAMPSAAQRLIGWHYRMWKVVGPLAVAGLIVAVVVRSSP